MSRSTRVTYHDPCYLGRHNEVYSPPRELLAAIPGLEVAEMPRSCESAFCCGGGGARVFMNETIGTRISVNRAEEAIATGATTIATACPFCTTMLTDGVAAASSAARGPTSSGAGVGLASSGARVGLAASSARVGLAASSAGVGPVLVTDVAQLVLSAVRRAGPGPPTSHPMRPVRPNPPRSSSPRRNPRAPSAPSARVAAPRVATPAPRPPRPPA